MFQKGGITRSKRQSKYRQLKSSCRSDACSHYANEDVSPVCNIGGGIKIRSSGKKGKEGKAMECSDVPLYHHPHAIMSTFTSVQFMGVLSSQASQCQQLMHGAIVTSWRYCLTIALRMAYEDMVYSIKVEGTNNRSWARIDRSILAWHFQQLSWLHSMKMRDLGSHCWETNCCELYIKVTTSLARKGPPHQPKGHTSRIFLIKNMHIYMW